MLWIVIALRCRARAGFSRRSRENHTMCGLGPASRVKIVMNDRARAELISTSMLVHKTFHNKDVAAADVHSRVFLKMVHDVIFSNSRFMDVFLHPKSMECILLVTYIYTKGQTGIQSSPAWLSTVFYCFEETTNKYDGYHYI